MMIIGFILTAGLAGAFLEPFTLTRLVLVTATVGACAFVLTTVAVWGVEYTPSQTLDEVDAEVESLCDACGSIARGSRCLRASPGGQIEEN